MNHKKYIDKHKKGNLSDEEWETLAQAMLNAKFDQEKQQKYTKMLKDEGIHREVGEVKLVSMKMVFSIAASVLILMIAGWFLFPSSGNASQQLAAQYLETPFQLNEGETRGKPSVEKNRGKAIETYNNQQYDKSIEYLQIVESQGQAKVEDYFQMGLCLMYQQQPDYDNALKVFEKVASIDSLIFKDERLWFSALCWLMLEDENKAKTLLEQVVESPSSRKTKEAQKILKEIK